MQAASVAAAVSPAFEDFKKLVYVARLNNSAMLSTAPNRRAYVTQLAMIHERAGLILMSLSDDQWNAMNPQFVRDVRDRYIRQGNYVIFLANKYECAHQVVGERRGCDNELRMVGGKATNSWWDSKEPQEFEAIADNIARERVPLIEYYNGNNNNNNNNNAGGANNGGGVVVNSQRAL